MWYDSGMYESAAAFLVMELLEGESLYDMLTRVRQLDFETTLRIATHSRAFWAGARVEHRAPRSQAREHLFDEAGDKLVAKLVDFVSPNSTSRQRADQVSGPLDA